MGSLMKKELKPGYSRYSVTRYTLTGAEKCAPVRDVYVEELILKDNRTHKLKLGQSYKKINAADPCEQTFVKEDRIITTGKKALKFSIGSPVNCVYTFLFTKL